MNLERAIEIAILAHKGQTDKAGQLYILHPLRVMMSVEGENAKIVAVLHDVVEDSHITLADIAQKGFSKDIIEAIDCLTKRKDENYFDYIGKIKETKYNINNIAYIVKLADLEDNMNMSRLKKITEKDKERCKKYMNAKCILLDVE